MLIILGLILISLIVIVGGDRGVVSLIALVGNLLLLSFAIWLMAAGVPVLFVTVGAGIAISCITLFYQNGTNVSLDDLVGRDWKPKKDHKGRNIAIKPQPKCISAGSQSPS